MTDAEAVKADEVKAEVKAEAEAVKDAPAPEAAPETAVDGKDENGASKGDDPAPPPAETDDAPATEKRAREDDDEDGAGDAPEAKRAQTDADAAPASDAVPVADATPVAAQADDTTTAAPAATDDQPAPRITPEAASGGDPQALETINGMTANVRNSFLRLVESGVVMPGEFDARSLQDLCRLAPEEASKLLDGFAHLDLSRVRNKSAYLSGMMRRVASGEPYLGTNTGGLPTVGLDASKPQEMSPVVQSQLEAVYQSGVIDRHALDQRCIELLTSLPQQTAMDVLTEIQMKDMSQIRNIPAFFTSLCRRAMQRGGPGGMGGGGYGGGGGGYGGGGGQPGYNMDPMVRSSLESLYQSGVIDRYALDQRCLDLLASLQPAQGMDVINQIQVKDMRQIRNIPAFFTSICRKAQQGESYGGGGYGGGGGGYGGGGGG